LAPPSGDSLAPPSGDSSAEQPPQQQQAAEGDAQ
jgi:hypothetical protein